MPIHGYPGNVISATPPSVTPAGASGVFTTEQQMQYQTAGNWPMAATQISRSLRFNSADSAYLNRTPASAGNRKTWTWSGWVKRSALSTGYILDAGTGPNTGLFIGGASDTLSFFDYTSGPSYNLELITTQSFRDVSAWYHIVVAVDTTQATSTNRVKIYLNGSQITAFGTATYPSQNFDTGWNNATAHRIGGLVGGGSYLNGYLTEINFIDGYALTPASFGQTNSNTGIWEPRQYTGPYGTNGFYLNFSDNSGTTSTTLGKDYSGNGNNWTPNNFSVTAGAGNDSLVDTPTPYGTDTGAGGEVRGNYCTLNGVSIGADATLTNGNLDIAYGSNATRNVTMGTFGMSSGKWYWEATITASSSSPTNGVIGITNQSSASSVSNYPGFAANGWGYSGADGAKYNNASGVVYGATFTTNDVIGLAFDADAGSITAYKNGVSQGVMYSSLAAGTYYPAIGDGSGGATFSASTNFGQRPFAYTAPSGFKALCTQNLPTPTIGATSTTQANDYFDVSLYTGTGSSLNITGLQFQPDFVWIKGRSGATDHGLYDAVRGVQKQLESNTTTAETTETTGLTAFNSDGFTVGALAQLNTSSATYASWNWKANGAGSSNTAGSISSTVSASTLSGFSIVTYTGTGANATVGHGLGVAPLMVIVRRRDAIQNWAVWHTGAGTDVLFLDATNAKATDSTWFQSTVPTSTVFSIGTALITNTNTGTYVAYCFAPVAGYSAFGSYVGNNSTDGPFIYTGFRPAMIWTKPTSETGNWNVLDNKRGPYNVNQPYLAQNATQAEATVTYVDFLSNGFKIRYAGATPNNTNATIIYAAFAESPFKYALAR